MNEQTKQLIQASIDALGASRYKEGAAWEGYDVYVPVYPKRQYIGLPYVVLVRGDTVRISTEQEALDYLAFSQKQD